MKLLIFFKGIRGSKDTMNYVELDVESWSTSDTMLIVVDTKGTVRYYPLINIELFEARG